MKAPLLDGDAPGPGADRSTDSYLPEHGNGGYRVEHYDLDLTYQVGPNRLAGHATISAVATQALSGVSLDLAGLRVRRVLVDGRPAKFSHRQHKLRIKPDRAIAFGAEFRVEIRYSGNPRPISGQWGEIGWEELTDGSLVASQPIGAPSWFPCNDHPADKAGYRISLTTASPYSVLVTGNPVSRRRGASTTTRVFEQRQPTPTYLMSVQIGLYEEVELAAGPVRQRAAVPGRLREHFGRDFARQGEIMQTLQRFFGTYPFDEYVVVVTEDELDDPIEVQGMAVFGANHIDGRRTYERLAVHELAHQWFGNSLTVADWRHIWLNEGFATYAEWLWSDVSGGPSTRAHALEWHARIAAGPADLRIADPGVARMFDEQVYKRGALTLYALHRRMGDERFFALLRAWTAEHRHGTVTTQEFIALAEQHANQPLASFFAAWIEDTSLPDLPR
jgi:aminopeptidase N